MYTLMKSEHAKNRQGSPASGAYEQKHVAEYSTFTDAIAACDDANREFKDRYYVLNESGKEFYAENWID